jgi:hypothetical protein
MLPWINAREGGNQKIIAAAAAPGRIMAQRGWLPQRINARGQMMTRVLWGRMLPWINAREGGGGPTKKQGRKLPTKKNLSPSPLFDAGTLGVIDNSVNDPTAASGGGVHQQQWLVLLVFWGGMHQQQWPLGGEMQQNQQPRLCIPTGVPIYSGPHFPEFQIFRGISGFRRNTHQN